MRALLIAVVFVSCLTSGCFVADELDSGSKLMDQHSRKKPAPEPKPGTPESSSSGSSLLSGMDASGAIEGIQDRIDEAMAKPPDPNNTMVGCEVEGRIRFTRKYDCQALGGRLVMR